MRRRLCAAASLFLLRRRLLFGSYHSVSLAWAEGALKSHTRNSGGGTAIEVLSVSSVCWVYASVLMLFGRSCCLIKCDCDRHDFFWAASAGVRALYAWAQLVPRSPFVEIHDLSHQTLPSAKPKQPMDCLGGVRPVWPCHVKLDQLLRFNSIPPFKKFHWIHFVFFV